MAEGSSGSSRGRARKSSLGSKSRSSSSGKTSSGSRSTSSRSTSSRSGSARSSASSSSRSADTKRSAAAKKGGQARGRQQTAQKRARQTASAASKPASAADFSGKSVADFREALTKNLIRPFNMVLLTRDRIEEVLGDAVSRGRVTSDDAQELVQGLVHRGRKETNEVLRDLEQLLGGGDLRKRGADTAGRARKQVEEATARVRKAADPVLAQADRARRTAGVGATFPISGYDDLSVAQVRSRLGSLTPAELRKVRDYERRHANRKTVLNDIEQRLNA
jgi:polyhydroxyalkanoate synthesis regulator phasin